MTNRQLTPGQTIAFGHTKRGQELLIRTLQSQDLKTLWKFINAVVKEDTYVAMSRPVSLKHERSFLRTQLQGMKTQDLVYLTAWVGRHLVGVCGIERRSTGQKRTLHVAKFGIVVGQRFRDQGIGKQLALAALDACSHHMPGIRLIALEVFATNRKAISLYQQLGFKTYGRLSQGLFYQGKYIDELFMYKKL